MCYSNSFWRKGRGSLFWNHMYIFKFSSWSRIGSNVKINIAVPKNEMLKQDFVNRSLGLRI